MNHISGFMCFGVLAEAGDFFKMIGPLLIFGVYIIGALAKGWTKNQQESDKENPSELRKSVRKRYQEIYQRQTGKSSEQAQSPRHTEPVRTIHSARPVEPPAPVRQVPRRTYPTHPVQAERHRRPVQQENHLRRNVQQKPVSVRTQASKPAQRPQAVRSHETKSVKQSRADRSLASMIRQPQNLRTAIILKEILDKPLALRDF